jgi:hypothetical protein
MPLESQICQKTYSSPRLNKLTPEQARLLLIGRATCGDRGAKDLLEVIYPAFQSEGNDCVPAYVEDAESGLITPGKSSVIRRTFAVLARARDKFHRLIRG